MISLPQAQESQKEHVVNEERLGEIKLFLSFESTSIYHGVFTSDR